MKTKEEIIREAYVSEFKNDEQDFNKRYDSLKIWIDKFGWFSGNLYDVDMNNFDISGHEMRPKSLNGLETNNGWTKIESEADLPKETITCWFISEGEYFSGNYNSDFKRFNIVNVLFNPEEVTHYQPIQKPLPPLH